MRSVALALSLLLAACSSNPERLPQDPLQAAVAKIKAGDEDISYPELRALYLDSAQVMQAGQANDLYWQQAAALQRNALECSDYDAKAITDLNVFALGAHILAMECYEKLGNTRAQQEHRRLLQLMITGILGSNSGDTYYDAYEVGSWSEADDLLDIAGLEVVDNYFELGANRAALYRVYTVFDPEQNQQRQIYFDNQRFLHRAIGGEFPFTGANNLIYDNIVVALKDQDAAAQLAHAMVLEGQQKFGEAEEAYLKAITMGSLKANIELGEMCLAGLSRKFSVEECAQLFVAAAEQDLELGKVYLAYMASLGLGMDRDRQLADDLLASIEVMQAGEPEFRLASLLRGLGKTPEAEQLSWAYLQQAVDQEHPEALYTYAMDQLAGASGPGSEQAREFLKTLRRAAARDHLGAQFRLADFEFHFGGDQAQALATMKQLADRQLPEALFELGRLYEFGADNLQPDLPLAFDYYQRAALKWHLEAQFRVGVFHTYGKGTPVDYELATAWYYLCAWPGNLDCITNLGLMSEHGWGMEQDHLRAAELYQLASEHGSPRATYNLAYFYQEGLGVSQDLQTAFQLYSRAADEGDSWAKNALALYYLKGTVVEADYAKAMQWFNAAAEDGLAESFYHLGSMYEQGLGVKADKDKAREYFGRARRMGYEAE